MSIETSPTIGKIAEALSRMQGMLKPAVCCAINPHFKAPYATLTSVVEAARPALATNGLAVVQGASVEEGKVLISTLVVHLSGEWIRDSLCIKLAREDAQGIGSAITYARRYSLASMIGIVSDDDDGEAAVGRPTAAPANSKPNLTTIKKTNEHKKERAATVEVAPINGSKPQADKPTTVAAPIKPATPVNPPSANGNGRVAKVRVLFNLSSQLGQSVDQMKATIGELLNLGKPIRESSDIPNDKLDLIVTAFQCQLADQAKSSTKEAA